MCIPEFPGPQQAANVKHQDNHYVTFCPVYWTSQTQSLNQVISKVDKGLARSDELAPFLDNRGAIYFHESMVRASAPMILKLTESVLLAFPQLDYRCWISG